MNVQRYEDWPIAQVACIDVFGVLGFDSKILFSARLSEDSLIITGDENLSDDDGGDDDDGDGDGDEVELGYGLGENVLGARCHGVNVGWAVAGGCIGATEGGRFNAWILGNWIPVVGVVT